MLLNMLDILPSSTIVFKSEYCQSSILREPVRPWPEADQLAIYKRSREVELGATENNIS